MLKIGVFLLLTAALLHSHVDAAHECIYSSPNFKKATANVTTEEEWKEVNATVDYATALLSSKNSKLSEIKVWGKELMDEVHRLNILDVMVLFFNKWEHSHFHICTAMELNETSKYYDYKMSLTDGYRNLYGILERMPNTTGIDLKRLNKYFSYIFDETVQKGAALEDHYLSKHLQCLQNVIRSSDKFVMDDIKEVYESYQYLKTIKEPTSLLKWIFFTGSVFVFVVFVLYKFCDTAFGDN
ncbi:hypothetical protein CAEBREN_08495 [Caenorhabditis brenneri]|uniref:Uncharacterized protein n=1 Tax=Caenorhabditis brenneri TaxID=135651 RepID=G0MVT5_CAEBE|nr:hypothetical protein CAEBREN_08495 [Caenorhabditis brenneri]